MINLPPVHHFVDVPVQAADLSACAQVPADPKMMLPELDEQELAAFKLTSLERNPKHTLMLDPMRCCPVSMMDMERWCHPGGTQQLAPEDRELLGVIDCHRPVVQPVLSVLFASRADQNV